MTKKDLNGIVEEAHRRLMEMPENIQLQLENKILNHRERLALAYLHGCLLTLNKNGLLCKDWELLINLETYTEETDSIEEY